MLDRIGAAYVSGMPGIARVFAFAACIASALPALAVKPADWPMFGQSASNTASTTNSGITTKNVAKLQPKWTFTTGGDVSARAAVAGGVAYFPDWGGSITAVTAGSGKLVWSRQISSYFGAASGTFHSRTTPAVVGGTVYIGTQEGAFVLALDAATGDLVWKTQAENADPFAIVTASPVVVNGSLYTGVASLEEAVAGIDPTYPCCASRGSVVALDAATGAIKWKLRTVPSGYSGGGVWGSNFVVDVSRGTLFAGTGNNYSHPSDPAYQSCISGGGTPATCSSPANHVDSILAIDLDTGALKWATKLVTWDQGSVGVTDGSDDWNVACFIPPFTNCPSAAGPDYDFASAPNLITYQSASGPKTILGAGQKSGIYYALDPDTGAVLWKTQVGPGSSLGGMEWGSATDGSRIYVSIANFYGIPTATAGAAGSWAALDPATGAVIWQVADPSGAIALGPLAVADGIVYAPSMAGADTSPTMLALDAATGQTLWSFAAGSSVAAGATVVNGIVYWGSGYAHLGIPGYTGNNKFRAFSVNGN